MKEKISVVEKKLCTFKQLKLNYAYFLHLYIFECLIYIMVHLFLFAYYRA